MDAEQVCPPEVPANCFAGERKVLIAPARLEYGGCKEAGGSEASAGLRYGPEGLDRAVEDIGAAGALNVNVDETRGDYFAFSVEHVVAGCFGFDLADLRDDAIFDKNGNAPPILGSIEQPAIFYRKFS
ncbi:MAG: hypothetical protein ACYTAO_02570 [Planctomycetota bacterium]|jgi:hypothetical protein